jgi:hypothetical protein
VIEPLEERVGQGLDNDRFAVRSMNPQRNGIMCNVWPSATS